MAPRHPNTADLIEAAKQWLKAGWHPIPATGKDGKAPADEGLTGHQGRDLTLDEIEAAFTQPHVGSLGLRMPEGVLGLDVDGYDGKQGPSTLAALCADLGVTLPPAPTVSGRLDGSGISFYRVPVELTWTAGALNDLGGDVDLITRTYRHAKAWPSVHHRTGQPIGRTDIEAGEIQVLDDGGEPWLLPPPDELPDLPPELVGALTKRPNTTSSRDAVSWENERGWDPEWAPAVQAAMGIWWGRTGSRHDAMTRCQGALVRLDSLGQAGATAAVQRLRDEFVAALAGERDDAADEFDRALQGAVAKVATSASHLDEGRRRVAQVFRRQLERYEASARHPSAMHITTTLPDAFWESRVALGWIRQAARSKRRSPDAVLAAVLARLSAILPPGYRIPGDVGSPATLAYYVALVGPSGAGKTTSAAVARQLLPIPPMRSTKVTEHNLGSGEGLIELYMGDVDTDEVNGKGNPIKERRQVKDGVIVVLDEGQALAEMGSRKGSIMLPTIRTMWSGGPAGQANAQQINSRKLEPLSYTLGLIVGIQPALSAELLQDTAAGTPQRFLWATITDTGAPRQRPPWPGPLPWRQPPLPRDGRTSAELVLAPEITEEIDYSAWQKVTGELRVAALDSQVDLMRLKTAGLLAVLDERLDVTLDDWALAGVVLATSDAVRRSVLDELQAEAALKEAQADARAARRTKVTVEAQAEAEDSLMSRVLEQAAGTVARKAAREGQVDRRVANLALSSRHRKLVTVEEALSYATDRGWLEVVTDGEIWRPGKVEP